MGVAAEDARESAHHEEGELQFSTASDPYSDRRRSASDLLGQRVSPALLLADVPGRQDARCSRTAAFVTARAAL